VQGEDGVDAAEVASQMEEAGIFEGVDYLPAAEVADSAADAVVLEKGEEAEEHAGLGVPVSS
jgi:hypothetical protein